MKKKIGKNQQSRFKEILYKFLNDGFFDGKGKTTLDVVKRLIQKGFTIEGRKIGMIARMLTQMCQDSDTGLERDDVPKEKRVKGERWIFKRIK